jgi:hypothetical protein
VAVCAMACSGPGDHMLGKILSEGAGARSDAGANASDGACVSQSYPATEARLNLYFMIDTSRAMMRDPNDPRWDALVSGFTHFLHTSAASGFGMGFDSFPEFSGRLDACTSRCNNNCDCVMMCGCPCNYFGDPKWPCGRDLLCDASGYDSPDVEIGPLPDNVQALSNELFHQTPAGPTIIRPALEGGFRHVASWEALHDGQRAVQVLLAGGPPSTFDCSSDTVADCVSAVASTSTKSYVIAFDYDKDLLAPIAAAGGGLAFALSSQSDLVVQFTDVVQQIRRSEARCDYMLPPVDPNRSTFTVEIKGPLTSSSWSSSVVRQVQSRADCDGTGPQWYYDRPDNPTRIVTCRTTCDLLQRTPDASVSFHVACPTSSDR